jgi:hypothetical protein
VVIERSARAVAESESTIPQAGAEPTGDDQPAEGEEPKAKRGKAKRSAKQQEEQPPTAEQEEAADSEALFEDEGAGPKLPKYDQKKYEFLLGREAHRNITAASGEVIVTKGDTLDDKALAKILKANLLGEVFIEMTLKK